MIAQKQPKQTKITTTNKTVVSFVNMIVCHSFAKAYKYKICSELRILVKEHINISFGQAPCQ